MAASTKDAEILEKLVKLLQNPTWKERSLNRPSEEPRDGVLKPVASTTMTEGSDPAAAAAAAALEQNMDDRSGGSDAPERTADVATQTNQQTLPPVPQVDQRTKDQRC